MPPPPPHAVFSGALGDNATGGWYAAQAVVSDGLITLWVGSPAGWAKHFSVPAREVTVKSAAQRITLKLRGRSYPILADPAAVNRALGLTGMGIAGGVTGSSGVSMASGVGRAMNQVGAANSFSVQGGGEFLAAARASGARVSRLGYGALAAIGCGGGLVAVLAVLFITVAILNL